MMLPTDRSPIDLTPPDAPLPAGKVKVTTAATTGAQAAQSHSDYNHQPLLVSGLEHYVKPEQDERFHVS